MRSGGNNFNYSPTSFHQKTSSDLRELHKWPLAFRGEQLLHLLHTSHATDLLAENCEFFLLSHLTPSLGVNPFEFQDELKLFIAKTRVLGYPSVNIS